MPNPKDIGERLKALRGDKSREDVAKACDISVSALGMYENGFRVPRDEIKIRLAAYYHRSVGYIFYAKESHE
jgi:transcriptional regulator with XRE-family HTH domain